MPIKGVDTGRSIVDRLEMDCFGSTWHVCKDVLLVCKFLISLFTIENLPLAVSAHGLWVVSV